MTQSLRRRAVDDAVVPHDGVILARVAQGDVAALAKIYDSYAAMLMRFARRLGAHEEAEDVVQDVFLRVLRLAPTFDAAAVSARAWLFTITLRVVQERRRSFRRLTTALSALARQKSPLSCAVEPQAAALDRCLQKLSLAKRSVLVLTEVEGFSCDEVAAMLQIPVGTVWTRLHHARRELRAAWGEQP